MTKEFLKKVIKEKIVDTPKYRYVYQPYPDRAEIQRLPIDCLDTTDAIDGWEIVKTYQ